MVVKQKQNNWLGKPLGTNKPVDFFKSPKKYLPVNMFKDSDRDGVANVFDCKPFNPKKQGFIDAIVGAVKGLTSGTGVRKGWSEGMARQGNYATRAVERYREKRRAAQIQRMPLRKRLQTYEPKERTKYAKIYDNTGLVLEKELPENVVQALREDRGKGFRRTIGVPSRQQQGIATQEQLLANLPTKEQMERQLVESNIMQRVEGNKRYQDQLANLKQKQILEQARLGRMKNKAAGFKNKVGSLLDKGKKALNYVEKRYYRPVVTAAPGYQRRMKEAYYQQRMNNPKLSPEKRSRAEYLLAKTKAVSGANKRKAVTRLVESVFPVESMSSYGSGMKTVQGRPGVGRGRPRGSLDVRYAKFGGVYGYRRYKSEQKRLLRLQLQAQEEQIKAQRRMQRMPQYEQQLPQEMQGQQVTQDYSQFEQKQPVQQVQVQVQPQQMPQQYPIQQYQQPQPQMPPQVIQREIRPVFKSSGGSPYKIPQRGLAPTRETMQAGYIEVADPFTGKRYMKQLPQREGWTR
jgi:hypothetical protein